MLFLIFFTFAVLITIIGALINRARKRRMVAALGRDVNDSELTSLNSWMDVAEKEDAKRSGN